MQQMTGAGLMFYLQTAGIPPLVPEHELVSCVQGLNHEDGRSERLEKLLIFTENINAVVNQANPACANTD